MVNIKSIYFPNTVKSEDQGSYHIKSEKHINGVDEIVPIYKNGEMALITWFQIIKDGRVIAEIKESVCDILGEDILPEKSNLPF